MPEGKAPRTHLPYAIACILIAAFFTSSLSALTKYSYSLLTTMQMIFARNCIGLVLFFGWLSFSQKKIGITNYLRTSSLKMQLMRSIAGFTSICLYFYSLRTIDLSDASVLFNTMPIFLPIVAYIWRGSKIHHKTWWGIGTAFAGILFVIRPSGSFFHSGALFALLSGLAGAVATLSLRYSHYTEPGSRTLFYYFFISTILSAFALLFEQGALLNVFTKEGLLLLSGIGILGLFFQIFYTMATKYAPAKLISPFYYSTVIFSVVYDCLLWNAKIDMYSIVGFVFVFIGVCLVVLFYPKEPTTSKPGAQ